MDRSHCRHLAQVFLFICFWWPMQGAAAEQEATVSIKEHPGFTTFKKTLTLIVKDRAPDHPGTHHFYIAPISKGTDSTYMLWKEGRKLWIVSLGKSTEESWLGMRYPAGGQLIDLDKGVVETEKEVGTSTYLVPRAWVNQRVYDTVVDGDLITIEMK